jgi:hypothetical protein
MKKLIPFAMLIIFSISVASAQTAKVKKDPVGEWKFEAPYAPEEYTSGIVSVSFAEKKYSSTMSFTGSDYKLPCENVKFENDTLSLVVYVEGENVAITLKMEDNAKMSGKAVYSGGEIPLTLARVIKTTQGK